MYVVSYVHSVNQNQAQSDHAYKTANPTSHQQCMLELPFHIEIQHLCVEHPHSTTLVAIAVALLMRPVSIHSFLHVIAAVEQDVRACAKQVKIPILRLAVRVASNVAGDVALHGLRLVAVVEVTIVLPAIGMHRGFVYHSPPPIVSVNLWDKSVHQSLVHVHFACGYKVLLGHCIDAVLLRVERQQLQLIS